MSNDPTSRWLVVSVRLPGDPSRHRVAVWRELRRLGAMPVGSGVWAMPATPLFLDGLDRVRALVDRGNGRVVALDGRARDGNSEATLVAEFNAARAAEWAEFVAECDKFDAEIAKERRIGKFTLAELDEEEQSLERLRRWWRELKTRDVFAAVANTPAGERLEHCVKVLDAYSEDVYRAVHAPLDEETDHA
ncbi:Chromate resistance protein ChrB [Frankia sp. EAN1pec]|uniref:Chromate resistance protein ChrB n=1 Tax=Parafrankia sp. (strain EAN1pec) TaxID=298653 RepID=UPI0018DD3DAF